ncbi:copper homeostasis protein CutC [Maribacter cobaltidurans]|uniref:PF03932 family protein CutC n=1 Tax=Maribacter cobaltidurans TaxID=1178778 RepID=A0A223V3E3_9FLAO|nr:copper homeostasis protein CutC [Maribacter cobaltidurans]ASV29508.1 copper homeostasis protein CutC [Maribacter cobaltidurans]GGD68415.1 copper homeostasis protein CutC [Maribacter cobaltidurans]
MLVEVCANSLESAINAEKAGADRIELCSELAVGGITPSYGLLRAVKKHISIPVHVLIRPRSGDFTYSEYEFDSMGRDIELCRELGFEGIVSGILHRDYTLDEARTADLIAFSKGLRFTFHRAFDWVRNPLETLGRLNDLGVDCVLTSGQQKSAKEGLPLLKALKESSSNIMILPGSGINDHNIEMFKKEGFGAVHLSGTKFHRTLSIPPSISMNTASFLKDDQLGISDFETIKAVVNKVK